MNVSLSSKIVAINEPSMRFLHSNCVQNVKSFMKAQKFISALNRNYKYSFATEFQQRMVSSWTSWISVIWYLETNRLIKFFYKPNLPPFTSCDNPLQGFWGFSQWIFGICLSHSSSVSLFSPPISTSNHQAYAKCMHSYTSDQILFLFLELWWIIWFSNVHGFQARFGD